MIRRTVGVGSLLVLLTGGGALAGELTFTVDVPASLDQADYLPNQTVTESGTTVEIEFDGRAYGLEQVNINGLYRLGPEHFLFTTDAAFEVQGATYEARDVVEFEAGGFAVFLDGDLAGFPEGTNIDALSLNDQGELLVSFDEPLFGGIIPFGPADIVRVDGTFLWSELNASSIGLPDYADVIGFDRQGDSRLLLFDTPVTVGGDTFIPGDVVSWDGIQWTLQRGLDDFPAYAASNGLSRTPSPGSVDTLRVGKQGADLSLAWTGGCGAGNDYAVFVGAVGAWTSHIPVQCTTEGATDVVVAPDSGDRYFLVVPLNEHYEGGYGLDSSGSPRPRSAATCRAEQRTTFCY